MNEQLFWLALSEIIMQECRRKRGVGSSYKQQQVALLVLSIPSELTVLHFTDYCLNHFSRCRYTAQIWRMDLQNRTNFQYNFIMMMIKESDDFMSHS